MPLIIKNKILLFPITIFFCIFLALPVKAAEISKAKLLSLAAQFLKERKIAWGEATEIRKSTTPCNAMIPTSDHHYRDERWSACYWVIYPTTEGEIKLLGEKSVVISLDGSRVGLTPRD